MIKSIQPLRLIVRAGPGGKPVADFVEIIVTGIPEGRNQCLISVSPSSPASGRRVDLHKGSLTVRDASHVDDPFHQAGRSRQHLEGGTRRCRVLGGVIILRVGLVRVQLRVILRIDGIGHLVVVISRIGHDGQHVPGVHVRDDDGGIAGIQRQLGGGDVQMVYPVLHETVCRYLSFENTVSVILRNLHHILFAENLAHLPAAYHVVQEHIFVKSFLEFRTIVHHDNDVFQNLVIYLRRVGIFRVQIQLADIHPVLGDTVSQVFAEANDLLRGPGDVSFVIGVHRLRHDDAVFAQQGHDVALVDLIFL